MVLSLSDYKNAAASEKTVVAHLEPSQRLMVFSVHSGSIYKKTVGQYVVNVHQDGTELTEVASVAAVNGAGKWFYDNLTGILYVWSTGSVDPKDVFTLVTYRLFYSNSPVDLPWNLTTGGRVVPYLANIAGTSRFGASLDSERKGTALESVANLTLYNNDGNLDIQYDKFYWEGKTVTIYALHRNLDLAQKYKLFDGVITGKDFAPDMVSFEISDFIFQLREPIPVPRYTSSDFAAGERNSELLPTGSTEGSYKRRVYGRVEGMILPSAQRLEDSDTSLTGTFSGTEGEATITGSGSDIHNELSPGDEITVIGSTTIESLSVDTLSRVDISANTEMTARLDWDAGTSDLDLDGISANIDTSNCAVGMHVVIKGQNFSDTNKGIWRIKSIPTSQILTLERAATFGDGNDDDLSGQIINDKNTSFDIVVVNNNTSTQKITLAGEIPASPGTFSASAMSYVPRVPTTNQNRKFFGTHHILQQPSTTVTRVRPFAGLIDVADITGLNAGDIIVINNQEVTIDTITPSTKTLYLLKTEDTDTAIATFLGTVSVSDTVTRPAFQEVFHSTSVDRSSRRLNGGKKKRIRNTGYTITNSTSGAYITFGSNAEKDAANALKVSQTCQWYNGARVVYSSAGEFEGFQARDFIKPTAESTWYEIEEVVDSQVVIIRTAYAGTSGYKATHLKYVHYITDESTVFANLYGVTQDDTATGELVKTASDVVEHLLTEAGLGSKLNSSSFDTAAVDNDMLMSISQPLSGDVEPLILRDFIQLVNETVYGSLFNNGSYQIEYKILTSARTQASVLVLKDEDVISWDVAGDSSRIVKTINGRYRHRDIDFDSLELAQVSIEPFTNPLITNNLTTTRVRDVDLYLYNTTEAQIMAQRYAHINRTAQSLITINTKLQTIDLPLNTVLEVRFDRLFARFGSSEVDRTRIGLINDIKKSAEGVSLRLDDLGNIFNSNYVIAPNNAADFSSADTLDKRYDSYITDSAGIISSDDEVFGGQVIS